MRLDQETLRFIFGFKLRRFRQRQGLSLQKLSKDTGISVSYINEIEKGKKYPKSDKILTLADALEVSYDELISLKLSNELKYLSTLLDKNIISGLPFNVFGIPANVIFSLMAENPKKFHALLATLIELTRTYKMKVEEFFFATLRAYLDSNKNYFPEIEESVEKFIYTKELDKKENNLNEFLTYETLKTYLETNYKYRIEDTNFKNLPEDLSDLLFIFKNDTNPSLFINKNVSKRQKTFLLAKELGYKLLQIKERISSSDVSRVDSYEKIENNFKASYFASALAIPKNDFIENIKSFFNLDYFKADLLSEIIQQYPLTVESCFHRFAQILPTYFGMEHLFYLHCEYDPKKNEYQLLKELHLSELHAPHGVKGGEHYCRRWISTSILKTLHDKKAPFLAGCQRSKFYETPNEYLALTIAYSSEINPDIKECVTIGILLDENTRQKVKFFDDPNIKRKFVSDICESCVAEDCEERAAPSTFLIEQRKQLSRQKAIEKIINQK